MKFLEGSPHLAIMTGTVLEQTSTESTIKLLGLVIQAISLLIVLFKKKKQE
jgi:hypothetical protein